MKKTICSVLLTGCFALAVFSGCTETSSPAATSTPTASAVPTASPSAEPEATASTTEAAPTASPSEDTLSPVLNELTRYGNGDAGTSLKTARAADKLLRYCCALPDTSTLSQDAAAWRDTLSDTDRENALANWALVLPCARTIAADPTSQAELLSEAGGNPDFSDVDLTRAEPALALLDKGLTQ